MKVIALEKKIRPFVNPSWPISSTNQVLTPCWKGHLGAWMTWHLVPITKSKSMEHNTYIWVRKNKLYMEMGQKKKNVHHPCCVGFLSPSRDEFKELSEKNSFLICKKLCRFVGWIDRVFFARGTSPGQKWWWTLLGREISCSQWEDPSMHSRCLAFFSF
jgi:hypothetical protein